ncbi:MAG: hypothetical protein U0414_10640 [Polyangiaceae bacterium]
MWRRRPLAIVLALLAGTAGCGDPGARAEWPSGATASAAATSSSGAAANAHREPPKEPNAPLVELPPLAPAKPSEARDWDCSVIGASVSNLAAAFGDVLASLQIPVARRARVCGTEIAADQPTAVISFLAAPGLSRWTSSHAGASVLGRPVFSGDSVWAVVLRAARESGPTLGLLSLDAANGLRRFELTLPAEYFEGLAPLEGGAVALAASSERGATWRGRAVPAGGFIARVERDGVLGFVLSAPRVRWLASSGDVLVAAAEQPFRLERADPETGRTIWSATAADQPKVEGLAVGDDGRVAMLGTALPPEGGVGLGATGNAPPMLFALTGPNPSAVLGVWSASGKFVRAAKIEASGGAWAGSLAFVRGEIGLGASVIGKGAFGALDVPKDASFLAAASPEGEPLRLVATSIRAAAFAGSPDGFVVATSRVEAAALSATSDPDAEEVIVFRRGALPTATR